MMRSTTVTVRRLPAAVAASAALVVLAAGCGSSATTTTTTVNASVVPPEPVGVQHPTAVASGGSKADTSCDPTASLRPSGTLPRPGAMPPGSTMAKIQKNGRLVVGVDQNTYLFGYRNSSTGAIEGFDIDMLHEVARAIFGDPDKIQYKVITAAERVDAVAQGDVDIVADTMTINCDRRKQVEFSAVYYEAGQRVLVDTGSKIRGINDLSQRRVCAAKGSTSIDAIAASKAKPIAVAVDNWTDCMVMLQQGQVDAVSTDDTILAGMAAQDPHTQLVGAPFTEEPYGMAISKSAPDFVRFVNGVLAKIEADQTWANIHKRWLGRLGATPAPPRPRYRD